MRDLFDRHVLPEWHQAGPDRWARIDDVRDDELWRVREQARERLVAFVRRRLRAAAVGPGDVARPTWRGPTRPSTPGMLTIGFARRFATYKRATLLLSQPERLAKLLLDADRPVQLVFAGKAHPADDAGKEMIRQIVAVRPPARPCATGWRSWRTTTSAWPACSTRAATCGSTTPAGRMEACGTSGEKAALNGGLNCSILDGWWDEMLRRRERLGHLVGRDATTTSTGATRSRRAACSTCSSARSSPCSTRPPGPARRPGGWCRVRRSLRSLGPAVSASRMVRDYVEDMYEPAAGHGEALAADGHARAKALAAWKRRVLAHVGRRWRSRASTTSVEPPTWAAPAPCPPWSTWASLGPDDVEVQLVHGPVGNTDEIVEAAIAPMHLITAVDAGGSGSGVAGQHRYEGTFTCDRPGRYGFTVRVVPSHPDLLTWAELGRMAVA